MRLTDYTETDETQQKFEIPNAVKSITIRRYQLSDKSVDPRVKTDSRSLVCENTSDELYNKFRKKYTMKQASKNS